MKLKFVHLLSLFLCSMELFSGSLEEKLRQRVDSMSMEEMQSMVEFLGDDLLEGRAPGTRGSAIAEKYIKSIYKFMDFEREAEQDDYLQPFSLQGFTASDLRFRVNGNDYRFKDDVVGVFTEKSEQASLKAEAVFVGFGIASAIMDWDDYKDVDVRGKFVVARVNDPGLYNPDIFEGKTLTYFGRWTYHIEEAARRGAAGILLIHTDETAGYDWNVVRNSWSGESLFIQSDLENDLKFQGWIKEATFEKILKANGIELADLYEKTPTKSFVPQSLGFEMEVEVENTFREIETYNVVASIPGKSEKRIVLGAHLDHLGLADKAGVDDDNIYNGAIDNGTAVASMMLVAKILKEFQDELEYSITILACNAEESGLLGSKFYAQNTDQDSILANINFESTPVWKASKSIMGIGARFSDFEAILKELAAKDGLEYSLFSRGNQGLFYRSDQYSFARYGIPAVWISAGEDEIDGNKNYTEFWSKDYHTVKDEYNPNWELEGMRQTIKYALLLVEHLNQNQHPLKWKDNLPFPVEEIKHN